MKRKKKTNNGILIIPRLGWGYTKHSYCLGYNDTTKIKGSYVSHSLSSKGTKQLLSLILSRQKYIFLIKNKIMYTH